MERERGLTIQPKLGWPDLLFPVGNQRPDTNDRVVDGLGELVAKFGSNLVIALAEMAVCGSEAFQVRDGFDIPHNEIVRHVAAVSTRTGRNKRVETRNPNTLSCLLIPRAQGHCAIQHARSSNSTLTWVKKLLAARA